MQRTKLEKLAIRKAKRLASKCLSEDSYRKGKFHADVAVTCYNLARKIEEGVQNAGCKEDLKRLCGYADTLRGHIHLRAKAHVIDTYCLMYNFLAGAAGGWDTDHKQ